METIFRFKRPNRRSRGTVAAPDTASVRSILPPLDYDPMSARTFVSHFDLGRII